MNTTEKKNQRRKNVRRVTEKNTDADSQLASHHKRWFIRIYGASGFEEVIRGFDRVYEDEWDG